MLKQLPNALTLARLLLAPLIAWTVWMAHAASPIANPIASQTPTENSQWATIAALLFVVAALTDLFDGLLARALNAESRFGRIIDPIADKLLVGLPLIALGIIAARDAWPFWIVVAASAFVIVARDLGITLWRMMSPDGEGVRVSRLAKYKTALELIAVGAPVVLTGAYVAWGSGVELGAEHLQLLAGAWAVLLASAAALSAWTGLQYLGVGARRS